MFLNRIRNLSFQNWFRPPPAIIACFRNQSAQSAPLVIDQNEKIKRTNEIIIKNDPEVRLRAEEQSPFDRRGEIRPFDDVPGPRFLKAFASGRRYLSVLGTQLTARLLTSAYSVGTTYTWKNSHKHLKYMFDHYGPVVRFISPIGGDIVLTNNPKHIACIYSQEGQFPVRSALDSLHKYRSNHVDESMSPYSGRRDDEWLRNKPIVVTPLNTAASSYQDELWDSSDRLASKIYAARNTQDELPNDTYEELHKWAFDCMGQVLLSSKMSMVNYTPTTSCPDTNQLYGALRDATAFLMKCESGLQLWKLFNTPAFVNLTEHCGNLEHCIAKRVQKVEQENEIKKAQDGQSVMNVMLQQHMSAEDVVTVIMDMLLIGVNTTATATSFLLYNVARSQKVQKEINIELNHAKKLIESEDYNQIRPALPYLQACIKETLRLVPPIPMLKRILPKSIVLDKFNIPRGTLVIMSTQDSSLKEANYEEAEKFVPERWLRDDARDYDAFASIPFGFGARKCLGQGLAEAAMTMLTIKLLQKFKIEYHYGDIEPTPTFIVKPNKSLKLRFIDRLEWRFSRGDSVISLLASKAKDTLVTKLFN